MGNSLKKKKGGFPKILRKKNFRDFWHFSPKNVLRFCFLVLPPKKFFFLVYFLTIFFFLWQDRGAPFPIENGGGIVFLKGPPPFFKNFFEILKNFFNSVFS